MVSKLYRDEAVVLRTYKLGEADRLLVLLTRQHGQVRAVAKGVARTNSRFGGRLQPFNLVDLQLHKGRNLDTVLGGLRRPNYGQLQCLHLRSHHGRNRPASN